MHLMRFQFPIDYSNSIKLKLLNSFQNEIHHHWI
jgi:hypothetical protein